MPVVADDGKVWLALVRGDRRLHELKLSKVLKQGTRAATPEEIEAAFGAKPGSIGPVGIREGAIGGIVADETLREGSWVTGANRTGWHLTGVEAAARLRGRRSPTCTRSRTATAARSATAC